ELSPGGLRLGGRGDEQQEQESSADEGSCHGASSARPPLASFRAAVKERAPGGPSGTGRRRRCVQRVEGQVGNELELGTAEGQAVVEAAEPQDDLDRLRIRAKGEVEGQPQSLHVRRLAVTNDS